MTLKLSIGIIGPGTITERALQMMDPLRNHLEKIVFLDTGASFSEKYPAHERTCFSKFSPPLECQVIPPTPSNPQDQFNSFMNKSDVIILNAGAYTPQLFLTPDRKKIADNLPDLEGILLREGTKIYSNPEFKSKRNYPSEEKYLADFVTAYQILKELKQIQEEQHLFPKPTRMTLMLPMTLPLVVEYAYKMRRYFEGSEVNPKSKFLIVNSNSSENCLDAVLSIVPELYQNAVSLAIDRDRLRTLINLDPSLGKPFFSILENCWILGDHDSYILPYLLDLKLTGGKNPDRIKAFKKKLESQYPQLLKKIQQELIDYGPKWKGKEDLEGHAGQGIFKILSSIFDKNAVNSGYFTQKIDPNLAQQFQLKQGEGLCFVNRHRVKWDGVKFKVMPDDLNVDQEGHIRERYKECQRAHLMFHQALIKNQLIPVNRFPFATIPSLSVKDNSRHFSLPTTEEDLSSRVKKYHRLPRLHTEVLVPSYIVSSNESKLTAVDLSTGETREHVFKDRAKEDSYIRYVGVLDVGGKQQVICTFRKDYVLLEPRDLREVVKHEITSPLVRDLPEINQKNKNNYRINSAVVLGEEIVLSHQRYGIVFVNTRTGKERALDLRYISPKESLRGVTVNPADGNIYFLVNNRVHVHSSQGNVQGVYRGEVNAPLESLLFSGDHLLASTDRERVPGHGFILAGKLGDYNGGLKKVESLKGDIFFLRGVERKGQVFLEAGYDNSIATYQVENQNGTLRLKKVKFHPLDGQEKISGMVQDIHTYVTVGMKGTAEQKLYELDQLNERKECLLDCGSQGREKIMPTLALLKICR